MSLKQRYVDFINRIKPNRIPVIKKWEYLLVDESDSPMYPWALRNYGDAGMELVAVLSGATRTQTRWVFKCPKPE